MESGNNFASNISFVLAWLVPPFAVLVGVGVELPRSEVENFELLLLLILLVPPAHQVRLELEHVSIV